MEVKGWLIVGPQPWSWAGTLAPHSPVPQHFGVPPDATNFQQGSVIEWIAIPGGPPVVLVCVRIPIMPGLQ